VNGGDNPYKKVEADAVAGLQANADCLAANPSDARLAVGLVGKRIVHVVRQLAVDADRLEAMQYGVAGSFEHVLGSGLWALGFGLFLPATGQLPQLG
jgi:hypothetical protein